MFCGTPDRQMFATSLRSLQPFRIHFRASAARFYASNLKSPEQTGIKAVDVLRELKPHIWPRNDGQSRRKLVAALALLIAGKVLNVQVPILFKHIIDRFNELDSPGILAAAAPCTVFSVGGTVLAGYIAARLGSALFSELKNVVFASVAQQTIRRVATNALTHLLGLDYAFHLQNNPGALGRILDRGIRSISFAFSAILFNVLPTAVEISLVCAVLTHSFGFKYALLTAGTMAAYTVFTTAITRWRSRFRRQMNSAETEASSRALDALLHHESVQNFNRQNWEVNRYSGALVRYERAALQTARSLFWLNFGQQAILSAGLTGAMVFGAQDLLFSGASIGDLVMLNGLILQLSLPLNFLGSIYRELRQSFVDLESLFALNRLQPTVRESSSDSQLMVQKGGIVFEDVSFAYEEGHGGRKVLNSLTFEVPGGGSVAFVGPSGSGKSTIARLLLRHFDPQSGKILIDSQNINQCSLKSLRNAVGLVAQDTLLFNESLAYNISYAVGNDRSPDQVTSEDIERVSQAAALHHHLQKHFPHGYETRVGERGQALSGGEKQRIAIARILLKSPPIMIFDESTASLDTQTERALQTNLLSEHPNCTKIFIAHRLSSVRDVDRIFVLDQGRIVQAGKHEELIRDPNSLYYKLWDAQAKKQDDAV